MHEIAQEWPLKSTLDPEIYGPPESAITTELIEKEIGGMISVEEVYEWSFWNINQQEKVTHNYFLSVN